VARDQRLVARKRRELVRGAREPKADGRGDLLAEALCELGVAVEAGADRGAAGRELAEAGDGERDVFQGLVQLRDPTGDLLAERGGFRADAVTAGARSRSIMTETAIWVAVGNM
jgi:hypothetical protein